MYANRELNDNYFTLPAARLGSWRSTIASSLTCVPPKLPHHGGRHHSAKSHEATIGNDHDPLGYTNRQQGMRPKGCDFALVVMSLVWVHSAARDKPNQENE